MSYVCGFGCWLPIAMAVSWLGGCSMVLSGTARRPLDDFKLSGPPTVCCDARARATTDDPGVDRRPMPVALPCADDPERTREWDDVAPADGRSESPYEPDLEDFERDRRGFVPPATLGEEYWYLDFGFRQGWTLLRSTEHRLDRRFELPMQLDTLGVFGDTTTPIDRKSQGLLNTAYLGMGRRENDWLTWNFYFGTGGGGDHNKQRWANLNLELNFEYATYYTGLTADVYPLGIAEPSGRAGFREILRASRPYLMSGFEVGYVRAKGWGEFNVAPIPIYADEQKVRDWLVSYLVGLGWEFPITSRWRLVVSGHYAFHVYRPEEYDGWNVTYALRYRF